MDNNEKKVKKYLESMDFTVECFSKAEMRDGKKTPDFRVSRNGEFLFYCEVKSSSPDILFDVGDSIFNRLTSYIYKASKQFDAVNSELQVPNVLALVNQDDMSNFHDLLEILTGNFYADDGSVLPISKKFSEGRIKEHKIKIHLIIWLDALDNFKLRGFWFSQINEEFHLKLCQWFGVNPNDIERCA